ncbi:hypothetical protein PIB30_089523 [Stylosanthes scabra]|uniref:Uncharacterized protein n=1 Tax=Stylosanthes scabra TaxID=79078 RepID=A0ABU6YT93_9FABA|nr:hypothetical protein [Stylosanthes scabra]
MLEKVDMDLAGCEVLMRVDGSVVLQVYHYGLFFSYTFVNASGHDRRLGRPRNYDNNIVRRNCFDLAYVWGENGTKIWIVPYDYRVSYSCAITLAARVQRIAPNAEVLDWSDVHSNQSYRRAAETGFTVYHGFARHHGPSVVDGTAHPSALAVHLIVRDVGLRPAVLSNSRVKVGAVVSSIHAVVDWSVSHDVVGDVIYEFVRRQNG